MVLNKVIGCCTMAIISTNPDKNISKSTFRYNINQAARAAGINTTSVKTVVMITNEGFFGRNKYRKLGFRKAYTYKGSGGSKAHVMHLRLSKTLYDYINP